MRTYLKGWSAPLHWVGSVEGAFAIDWYAGPLGTEFGWPVGGKTRGRGDVGPLFLTMGGHDCITPDVGTESVRTHTARSESGNEIEYKLCRFGEDDWQPLPNGHVFLPSGYTLYTLVLDSEDGETMFGFTHVLKEALLDTTVTAQQKFARVGDSGLEPFTARGQNPAHIHLAIMKDRTQFGRWQGGQGNIMPWNWLVANGFNIRNVVSVPSPQMYMNGYKNTQPY